MIVVRAPASMMLMGEHAVLHKEPALVCALDQWMTVRVLKRDDDQVLIHSALGEYRSTLSDLSAHPHFRFVLEVIRRQSLSFGIEMIIESEFASTVGLGSSAAVVVASLLALCIAAERSWDHAFLLQEGRSIVQQVQGCGSGADVAASVYGGIVRYHAQENIQRVNASLPIHLIYSGYKTPTPEVIAHVETWRAQNPKKYAMLFQTIGALVDQAMQALQQNEMAVFEHCVSMNQRLMQDMGVCDDHLLHMIEMLHQQEGVRTVKISGSGLGDCVYALADAPIILSPAWIQKGVCEMKVQLSADGVQVQWLPLTKAVGVPKGDSRLKRSPLGARTPGASEMMNAIHALIGNRGARSARDLETVTGQGEAPTNIALIKYWGKRDALLNLPCTDSLSVSLPGLGAKTHICKSENGGSQVFLNDQAISAAHPFAQRVLEFLNMFHCAEKNVQGLTVRTTMNIPHSAGLASSACGFAALVLALDDFFKWDLSRRELSILARLGSGSACRSLFSGFVKWQVGVRADGMDSFAFPCPWEWKGLCLGLLILSDAEKPLSSRVAMNRTVATSSLYPSWPKQVLHDQKELEQSILSRDFETFGRVIEHNALSMHATMMSAWPPIVYALPETLEAMKKIMSLREQGVSVFFTQDAGPNLKLFFQSDDLDRIARVFSFQHVIPLFN